jgi:leucyl-tRNA synthetase
MEFNKTQAKWQKAWEKAKLFEANPDSKKEKFFMTIPYPYISGSLHIGHARVVTEADVFSRFQRMDGKNVLYPIAFHISGTPVLGISLAIKNGDKKKIALYKGYVDRYETDKTKVDKIIKSFENPQKIVDYFIPKMKEEFKTLGLNVDWRRSYTSGSKEHQALVEWQFKKYKEQNYLVQGKYPILFSKTLNNAVGEDDISDGDTDPVELQEFAGIKFKFEDGYLIAATLRPETMYGQTNMWVHPDVDYVKAKVDGEIWFISKPCIEKLKFQDHEVELIEKVKGKYFIGKNCFAPFVEREIPILPSIHCDPEIGTGIVTCVPSDAPFDYISLKELWDSKEMCEKYGLDHSEIKKIKLISIIKSKGYGEFPGKEICEKMKITKLSQEKELQDATQEIYKAGFHTGKMMDNCGSYKGMRVVDAKDKMKEKLIGDKKAILFYETSRKAKSRDGGEIIVAILDNQWFLDFNAKGWKEKAKDSLSNMELWPDKYRKQFEDVFDWLDKRPCARMRGLGTKLPFDENWIIESLSDSTIYMSLYPIAHLINENNLSKEQMDSNFFEYVINSKGKLENVTKSTGIDSKLLKQMNAEWNYWYPFEQRHTFQAHLSNHLSFMIFAHTACFEKKHWPKRVSFHGMVISEGEKMSKSKGNVVTLVDINERFGADPFRAFMCNSTSVDSTFNWDSDKVELMKKSLNSLFELIKGIEENTEKNDSYKKYISFVSKTEKAILNATKSINEMDLRKYSNVVIYDMLNNYKKIKTTASKKDLKSINNYIGVNWIKMLTPLVPHLAEELWSINNEGFVSIADWPKADESLIDESLEKIEGVVDTLRGDIFKIKDLAKIEKVSKVKIFVAPDWKWDALAIVKKACGGKPDFGLAMKSLMKNDGMKKHGKEVQTFLKAVMGRFGELQDLEKFDESKTIEEVKPALEKEFGTIEIVKAADSIEPKAKNAFPGKPALLVE